MLPPSLEQLVESLSRLPGIGKKTAMRLAFRIMESPETANMLIESVILVRDNTGFCPECGFFSDKNQLCSVCANVSRDRKLICVVSRPQDILAIEKSGYFKGIYHVLNGVINPLSGIGPEDIRITELTERIEKENPSEIILALDTTPEGETTSLYLADLLAESVTVSRIASGIPYGGEIEYVDGITIQKAFFSRRKLTPFDSFSE